MRGRDKRWRWSAAGVLLGAVLAGLIWRRRALPHAGPWRTLLARWYGAATAGVLIGRARSEYAALAGAADRPRHPVLAYHVTQQIWPALAVYRSLLAAGVNREESLARLLDLVWATLGPLYRLSLAWLRLIPDPFGAWRGAVKTAMTTIFPPAGWRRRPIADDATHYGFDIVACIYLETLSACGAPELTAVFCEADERLAGLLPAGIRWERRGTLGMGQTHCDFRWGCVQGAASKTGPSRQTS